MANSNDPKAVPPACLLDSDVLINWLTQEEGENSAELWRAPFELIKLIESKSIRGYCSLISLMEIRFVLRRKKGLAESAIQKLIEELMVLMRVVIPDEVNLLKANNLQMENPLSVFDALLIALGSSIENVFLVSRDKTLLESATRYLNTGTPEDFLNKLKMK